MIKEGERLNEAIQNGISRYREISATSKLGNRFFNTIDSTLKEDETNG